MEINSLTIRELRDKLKEREITSDLIQLLKQDSRKGVQKLAEKYSKIKQRRQQKFEEWQFRNKKLEELSKAGYRAVVGIDEAGRGPLAGPVVAAAVIIDKDCRLEGLDDSKKLSEGERQQLFNKIKEKAVDYGIGVINSDIIDEINILQATFKAMKRALAELSTSPDYILVDGNRKIPSISHEQEAIIEGDSLVNSISAASIMAKVTRDQIIFDYHDQYPEYNFISNKGYGTSEHISSLKKYGPCPIHRQSFAIVNKYKQLNLFEQI